MVTLLFVLKVVCFLKKYKGNLNHNFAIHEYNTTGRRGLHTEFCNTVLFQKSVINMGVNLYKFLPSKIKNL
jgi:hypothetical protein